jgi:hypothetical protein
VKQAELNLITLRKLELCHRELAFVTIAEDADTFRQHGALSLLPMWFAELIKLGVAVATVEAGGSRVSDGGEEERHE